MSKILQARFGARYLGPERWAPFAEKLGVAGEGNPPPPSWPDNVLQRHEDTHLLLYAPRQAADGGAVTLNGLRQRFGMDPAVSEPCFYNQDWYLKEDFAARQSLEPGWHLLPVQVLEQARGAAPQEIEAGLPSGACFSLAVNYAFAFFAYWLSSGGQRLWEHDFVWCRDRDHNGDRIYVGRYADPTGVNKNGFNIHRHLSLRPFYSAAPEIMR